MRSADLSTGSESVMLVEDQPGVRALTQQQLTLLGYRVVAYASAEEATSAIRGGHVAVDVLITDVVLAGMSGASLVKCLRVSQPHLRVLYVSGYNEDAVLTHGLNATARLLAKPFSLQELALAVRAAIDEPE